MKNRFLLFAGENYYPQGGAEDFICGYDTIEQAMDAYDKMPLEEYEEKEWANILDIKTLKPVKFFFNGKWREHGW